MQRLQFVFFFQIISMMAHWGRYKYMYMYLHRAICPRTFSAASLCIDLPHSILWWYIVLFAANMYISVYWFAAWHFVMTLFCSRQICISLSIDLPCGILWWYTFSSHLICIFLCIDLPCGIFEGTFFSLRHHFVLYFCVLICQTTI